jgi:hypothetical protein
VEKEIPVQVEQPAMRKRDVKLESKNEGINKEEELKRKQLE